MNQKFYLDQKNFWLRNFWTQHFFLDSKPFLDSQFFWTNILFWWKKFLTKDFLNFFYSNFFEKKNWRGGGTEKWSLSKLNTFDLVMVLLAQTTTKTKVFSKLNTLDLSLVIIKPSINRCIPDLLIQKKPMKTCILK